MSIHSLRKRFVKDQSLPILLLQDPHFDYYLDLYEEQYSARTLYELLEEEVEQWGSVELFLQSYNELKNTIIGAVLEKKAFKDFNNDRLEQYQVQGNIPKANLYSSNNHRQNFISIDLKKANFHTLRYYDSDMVNGSLTYEEWLANFTNSVYMKKSKYIRQVIFGNLNPKKQQKIQKFVTYGFLEKLKEYVSVENIMSASHDEIIVKDQEGINMTELKVELEKIYDGAFPLHIEKFTLVCQHPVKEFGFVKEYHDSDKVEFKGVPGLFMAQAYKNYLGKEVDERDLLFYQDGYTAKFVQTVLEKEQALIKE